MRAMRVSVMNWQTNQLDVERTIKTVAQCLNQSKKLGTARMFPN
jgi:hypothetical protein